MGRNEMLPGSGWARISLPTALRMPLEEIAKNCGWQSRRTEGGTYVRTDESYFRRSDPALLSLHDLIDPAPARTEHASGFAVLGSAPDQTGLMPGGLDPLIDRELQRHHEDGGFGAAVAALQLMYGTCASSVLPDQVREIRTKIVPAVDDESSLHVLRLEGRLSWRAAAVRTLLAAEISPGSFTPAGEAFAGFRSGQGLLTAMTFGAVPYLAPALLTASPYVNGVMVTRVGVNLVWLFDEPLAGRVRPTDEVVEALADTRGRFHPRGGGEPRAAYGKPTHGRDGSLEVLRWWTRRVNVLLAAATDVGRFIDAAGDYEPRRHFAFVLSLERLFTGVHQTLVEAGRNETLRLSSAYDALDCLDGMGAGDFASMTTPSKARAALNGLQVVLPAKVAEVVLPRCESAVQALEGVRDGFFLPGTVTAQGLAGLPGVGGTLGWDRATAEYLRIDRNSAHSFVNELEAVSQPRKFALFSAHDGRLSHHLADLSFLWLVRLLADPSLLSRVMDGRSRRAGRA